MFFLPTSRIGCAANFRKRQFISEEIRTIQLCIVFVVSVALIYPYCAEIFLYHPWRPKGYFQFEIIINVLVGSLPFIWMPIWYGSTTISNISILSVRRGIWCAGIVFIRQNLTSTDVRFWRMKTVPALNELTSSEMYVLLFVKIFFFTGCIHISRNAIYYGNDICKFHIYVYNYNIIIATIIKKIMFLAMVGVVKADIILWINYSANTTHLYNINTLLAQRCIHVIQMFCVFWNT